MQLQKLNPDDDDEGMKTKNILISANDYLNFSDAKTFSKNSSYAQTLSSEETVFTNNLEFLDGLLLSDEILGIIKKTYFSGPLLQ